VEKEDFRKTRQEVEVADAEELSKKKRQFAETKR
jgi:hypothetical protein